MCNLSKASNFCHTEHFAPNLKPPLVGNVARNFSTSQNVKIKINDITMRLQSGTLESTSETVISIYASNKNHRPVSRDRRVKYSLRSSGGWFRPWPPPPFRNSSKESKTLPLPEQNPNHIISLLTNSHSKAAPLVLSFYSYSICTERAFYSQLVFEMCEERNATQFIIVADFLLGGVVLMIEIAFCRNVRFGCFWGVGNYNSRAATLVKLENYLFIAFT